jgi:hypothetical protein
MHLFLHFKKTGQMSTKKPLFLLAGLFFLITAAKSQGVVFKFTNGTTVGYKISDLQNFTYGTNTIIVKPTASTAVTYNLSNLVSYRYDLTLPVNELDVINTAEVRIYPNPFRESVQISYELSRAEQVTIEILDITGKTIKKWPAEKKLAGSHNLVWQTGDTNGSIVKPGTYICRIQTSIGSVSKMIVME